MVCNLMLVTIYTLEALQPQIPRSQIWQQQKASFLLGMLQQEEQTYLEVAHNVWMLQAGQSGHFPYQTWEALWWLGLHLDLLHSILAAVKAIDGRDHNPIAALAQRAQLLKVTLIPWQPCMAHWLLLTLLQDHFATALAHKDNTIISTFSDVAWAVQIISPEL